MYGSSWDRDCFIKNFCFNTICNITQETQKLQRCNCACGFIGKSAVIKYHQLLSKLISINRETFCFSTSYNNSSLLYPSKLFVTWFALTTALDSSVPIEKNCYVISLYVSGEPFSSLFQSILCPISRLDVTWCHLR